MFDNLNYYRVFYTVANTGNISKAADMLFISQPAISKAISKLEDGLHVKLFLRSSKGVTLTDEGQVLYNHIEKAFSNISQGEDEIRHIHELGIGQLKIGVSTSLCKHILLDKLQTFILENPHIKVIIDCHSTVNTLKLLNDGRIDIGLICKTDIPAGFEYQDVSTIHDIFVVNETYLSNLHLREQEEFAQEPTNPWLFAGNQTGIMGNLDGLLDNVNQSVGEIATQVGTTPADWNAGVFSMIRQISETAILPIAGVILTFVMTYELIQMLIERNNLHEVDTWMFFKWVFKTFVAVMILTNTFNIVLAVFDVSQHVIQQSAGIIQNGTEITPDVLDSLRTELEAMELGPLFGLWLQSFLIQLTMIALNIVIFVIVYGRMIEIYLLTSLAPIPFATVPNRETGHMGQNYFRSLFAVGFQGLLILVCVAIYAVLIQSIATDGDPIGAIWGCVGKTVLQRYTLFKTGSLAKSIFGCH